MNNLIDVMSGSDKFKALFEAIKIAGMIEELRSGGPYTVFAPTDGAVCLVEKEKFTVLLQNKELLRSSVKFFFIGELLEYSDLLEGTENDRRMELRTLEGSMVELTRSGILKENIYVNDANLITPDIRAENGIIHGVDKVLFRPTELVGNQTLKSE